MRLDGRAKIPRGGEIGEAANEQPPHGLAAHHGWDNVRGPVAQKTRQFQLQFVPNRLCARLAAGRRQLHGNIGAPGRRHG